jgi:hypothetical protein
MMLRRLVRGHQRYVEQKELVESKPNENTQPKFSNSWQSLRQITVVKICQCIYGIKN